MQPSLARARRSAGRHGNRHAREDKHFYTDSTTGVMGTVITGAIPIFQCVQWSGCARGSHEQARSWRERSWEQIIGREYGRYKAQTKRVVAFASSKPPRTACCSRVCAAPAYMAQLVKRVDGGILRVVANTS